jgi:uncharacterized membrane protein YidH (DUF202 family)
VNRDPDDDPGLARERTALAWTRTALSFGAVGGVIVKSHVIIGLIVLGIAPLIWQIGRLAGREPPERVGRRNQLITATLIAVALVALTMSFLGRGTPLTIRLAGTFMLGGRKGVKIDSFSSAGLFSSVRIRQPGRWPGPRARRVCRERRGRTPAAAGRH